MRFCLFTIPVASKSQIASISQTINLKCIMHKAPFEHTAKQLSPNYALQTLSAHFP
jgi:hypothetical protein